MNKHIVVIEDDPDVSEAIKMILEHEGYRVSCIPALTDVEGLIALNADLYILDEQLPYVNGHIICIILRSKPQTKDKPVILISALEEMDQFTTLCEANGYLQKPFLNISELTTMVDRLINKNEKS